MCSNLVRTALVCLLLLVLPTFGYKRYVPNFKNSEIHSVTLRMCKDCIHQFNFVSHFIHYDIQHFRRIYLDQEAGGYPRLVIRNREGKILRVVEIHHMTYLRLRNLITKDLEIQPKTPLIPLDEIHK